MNNSLELENTSSTELKLRNLLVEFINYDFDIPINVKIFICVVIIVIISVITFLVSNGVNISLIDSNYGWYYIIALFNLVNIILILYYYQYKSEKLKVNAPVGEIGETGKKGDRGKYISCSYCKSNIYIQKTKRYSLVLDLKLSNKLKLKNDTKLNEIISNYNKTFNSYKRIGMDFDSLDVEQILNGTGINEFQSDMFKKSLDLDDKTQSINTNTLQKLINMENLDDVNVKFKDYAYEIIKTVLYLSMNKINLIITRGQTESPGSFYNITGGKIGFFPIGDTVFNGNSASRLNSFMVNGDIRNPVRFEKKTHITTFDNGEFGETYEKIYTVWRPIAPNNYVAMGDIIKNDSSPPRTNLLACVSKDCVKDIGSEDLELVFVNYGTITSSNYSLSDISLYSIWRTTMNTMYIKTTNDTDIKTGSIIYNIIGDNDKYFDEYGQANSDGIKLVKEKLRNIKLPKFVYVLFIQSYYITFHLKKMKERANLFYESSYYSDLINEKEKLKRRLDNKFISEEKYKKEIRKINKILVARPLEIVQNAFTKKIKKIPQVLASIKNLYDLLLTIIPGGLEENITINMDGKNDNDIEIQIQLLKLCRCLFPPNLPNYIIKNECIAFDKISTERRKAINELKKSVSEFKYRMKLYNENPEEYCGEAWEGINNHKEQFLFDYIQKYLGHIVKNPIDNILNLEFDAFPESRLKVVLAKFKEFNELAEDKCKSIFDNF